MAQIIPIRDLKNTSTISDMCHKSEEPIYITKNGYGDMVMMSIEYFDKHIKGIEKCDIYTIAEITGLLYPILRRYNVRSALLFGSYAKGLATKNSDIDLLVDSGLKGLAFYGLLEDISNALKKEIDLIDIKEIVPNSKVDLEIKRSGVKIYG